MYLDIFLESYRNILVIKNRIIYISLLEINFVVKYY